MKTINLTLLILIAITIGTYSQIPNNGFENWSTYGTGMTPDDWWSANDSVNSTNPYFPITRSTDHYPVTIGNYSLRLENNPTYQASRWAELGIAWTGSWKGNNNPVFPVNHPKSICGYYKFLPQNGDTMDIHFILYKNGVEITQGGFQSPVSVPDWTSFNLPVSNLDYTDADSARILIAAFYSNNKNKGLSPLGNSVLYVDNLSFDSLITTSINELSAKNNLIDLYPNPASDYFTVKIINTVNEELSLKICTLTGTLVKSEMMKTNQQKINIGSLATGLYMVMVKSKNLTEIQKLIIQR